jgi:glycoside/pentoside/hexuronide:cation symporter, GPH family
MENEVLRSNIMQSASENKLKISEKISYGFGDLASNVMWGLVGSFLLYFYTDVALIPAAATATLFLVARVLDAFIDPIIGNFVDKTNSKYGRTRPFILFGIIPFCIMFVLTFTTFDLSDTGKLIYAYVTYIIVGILYSVVNVPYGALMPLMTRNTNEKAQLSSFRMLGMAVGNIFVSAGSMALVNILGKGNQRTGFLLTAMIFAVAGLVCFMIVCFNCKERYLEKHVENQTKAKASDTYKNALKNTPWVASIAFAFFMFVRIGAVVAITIYFCMYVLKNPGMIPVLLPLLYVSVFITAPLTPMFIKKFGHRKANIIGLSIYIAAFCIMPLFVGNMPVFIGIYFIGNVFGGIGSGSIFGMIADSVDYNEWKYQKRTEGTLYAGYSFATKVGMAVGGAAVGYVLAFTGYNAANVTASAASGINILYYAVPIVCSLIQIIALGFYKLDAIHPQIIKELAEKNQIEGN